MPTTPTAAGATPVSIISKSRLLRDALVPVLATHMDLCLVGSYAGAWPGIVGLPNPADHVVLLDSGVGPEEALAWTRYWRRQTPPAPVLILEMRDDLGVILALIEAGAGGYTLQGAAPADVAAAIVRLQHGAAVCSPEVTGRLFAQLAGRAGVPPSPPAAGAPLTAREREVLDYIAADYSNQEIAAALVIEVRTVKHHVHNILEKLHLRHRWDAARLAAEQGWLGGSIPDQPVDGSPPPR